MQAVTTQQASLRILVGDDQPDILQALRLLLKSAGHRAVTVDSPAALLRAASDNGFDLVLMDLNYARDTTSGQEGLDLLQSLRTAGNTVPVVVMTAWGNIELAVEAMRRGAADFIQKPWDNARLLDTVQKQSSRVRQTEMELARHVQRKLFPQEPVSLETLECACKCLPAREVSGDYYDFLHLSPSRTGFVLADVSGKGMASALLMANLQGSFRSQQALALRSPQQFLATVNQQFYESTPPEHYATLFYADYDEPARHFRYANCGHPPGILIRAGSQTVERLPSNATIFGMFPVLDAPIATFPFATGDTLVLFSDGVTEAGIETGAEYGEDRLISLLLAMRREPPARILDRVLTSLTTFSEGRQHDDITLMVLRGK